jgi:hypothetical protein
MSSIFRPYGTPWSPYRHPRPSWPQPSVSASSLRPQNHDVEFGLTHKAIFSYAFSRKSSSYQPIFLPENQVLINRSINPIKKGGPYGKKVFSNYCDCHNGLMGHSDCASAGRLAQKAHYDHDSVACRQ